MKKVLFLGAPVFQIPIVQKAKQMGLYVGIVDIDKNAPALSYADESFICSIRDCKAVLDIAKDFKPDGIVIGACDTSVVTCAYACEKLGLPGENIETSINSTNKVKMLEMFENNEVSHPKFQVVAKDNIDIFNLTIPYPVISKPIDSAGGRGVSIIHNDEELKKAVKYSSKAGLSGDVLIEEYMKGKEVSVEMLVVDGTPHILQITDKVTSGEPYFYEIGHSQPTLLPFDIQKKVKDIASKAVKAVGMKNSPAHVEIIVTNEGPKMVELGARLGGDCITTYLLDNTVLGINMAQAAIEFALGIKPNIDHYQNSGVCAGVRFIPAKKGRLKAIKGLQQAQTMDDIIKIDITGEIGQCYDDADDDSSRFGYVVCRGKTTEEAMNQCTKVIEKIQFELD